MDYGLVFKGESTEWLFFDLRTKLSGYACTYKPNI
jgi:hypothetical protein